MPGIIEYKKNANGIVDQPHSVMSDAICTNHLGYTWERNPDIPNQHLTAFNIKQKIAGNTLIERQHQYAAVDCGYHVQLNEAQAAKLFTEIETKYGNDIAEGSLRIITSDDPLSTAELNVFFKIQETKAEGYKTQAKAQEVTQFLHDTINGLDGVEPINPVPNEDPLDDRIQNAITACIEVAKTQNVLLASYLGARATHDEQCAQFAMLMSMQQMLVTRIPGFTYQQACQKEVLAQCYEAVKEVYQGIHPAADGEAEKQMDPLFTATVQGYSGFANSYGPRGKTIISNACSRKETDCTDYLFSAEESCSQDHDGNHYSGGYHFSWTVALYAKLLDRRECDIFGGDKDTYACAAKLLGKHQALDNELAQQIMQKPLDTRSKQPIGEFIGSLTTQTATEKNDHFPETNNAAALVVKGLIQSKEETVLSALDEISKEFSHPRYGAKGGNGACMRNTVALVMQTDDTTIAKELGMELAVHVHKNWVQGKCTKMLKAAASADAQYASEEFMQYVPNYKKLKPEQQAELKRKINQYEVGHFANESHENTWTDDTAQGLALAIAIKNTDMKDPDDNQRIPARAYLLMKTWNKTGFLAGNRAGLEMASYGCGASTAPTLKSDDILNPLANIADDSVSSVQPNAQVKTTKDALLSALKTEDQHQAKKDFESTIHDYITKGKAIEICDNTLVYLDGLAHTPGATRVSMLKHLVNQQRDDIVSDKRDALNTEARRDAGTLFEKKHSKEKTQLLVGGVFAGLSLVGFGIAAGFLAQAAFAATIAMPFIGFAIAAGAVAIGALVLGIYAAVKLVREHVVRNQSVEDRKKKFITSSVAEKQSSHTEVNLVQEKSKMVVQKVYEAYVKKKAPNIEHMNNINEQEIINTAKMLQTLDSERNNTATTIDERLVLAYCGGLDETSKADDSESSLTRLSVTQNDRGIPDQDSELSKNPNS